jgi:UDP-N-acetylmuramoylalanine--D-glutamate ligase
VVRLPLAGGGASAVGPSGRILPLDEIRLPGAHNVSNALAAVAVGLLFGIAPDGIRRAVAGFQGVEHRLEPVAEIEGVLFVNDSQGTQPDAVIAALRSFDPPVILIAGGRDKGVPLDELGAEAVARAEAVVLIGETAPAFETVLRRAGHAHVERADSLEAAVSRADALAREALSRRQASKAGRADGGSVAIDDRAAGRAVVLLSPAAASFDMFADYAARGRAFKAAVADLAARRTPR